MSNELKAGHDRGFTHDDLIDRVRWRAREYLAAFGFPHEKMVVTPGDGGAMIIPATNSQRPDVMFVSEVLSKGVIMVECGAVPWSRQSKWRGICSTIHIDFFGGVSLLDKTDDPLERLIFRAVQAAFDPWEPTDRSPVWWHDIALPSRFDEERALAQLCTAKIK